jgi:O-antigen/teichoic acid export membrane protein
MFFAIASLIFGLHTAVTAILRGRLRFGTAATTMAAGRVVTAIATIAAFLPDTMSGRMALVAAALLLGEIVTLAASLIAAFSLDEVPRPTAARLRLRSALPFAANSVLALAYNRLDVIVLVGLSSAAQLALYAPASRIQDGLYILPATLGIIALPLVAASTGRRESRLGFSRRLSKYGVALALAVTIPLFVFMRTILVDVLGPSYADAATASRILIWFLPFAALTAPLLAFLAAEGRATDTTAVFAVAFVVAMTLHFSLDWWWGANGAALASLLREPAAACTAIVLVRRSASARHPPVRAR